LWTRESVFHFYSPRVARYLSIFRFLLLTLINEHLTETATHSCRDPETAMLFLVASWRPPQAAACRGCRRCCYGRSRAASVVTATAVAAAGVGVYSNNEL